MLNAEEDFKRLVEQHIYTFYIYIYSPSFAVNIVLQNLQKQKKVWSQTPTPMSQLSEENSMDAVIKEFDFFSANHQDNKDAPSNVDVSACFLTLEIIDLITPHPIN